MTTRLEITGTATLPEAGQFKILAAAEDALNALATEFNKTHGTDLVITARPVNSVPRKPKASPISSGDKATQIASEREPRQHSRLSAAE